MIDDETMDAVEEAQRAMAEARARLADVPAEVVITNHVMGLYELAAIHLSAGPPDLVQAALAIDAVACLVDGLGDRLGDEAPTMRDALNNIRLAFVQIKGAVAEVDRRLNRPDGALRTRPSRTSTPSERNRRGLFPDVVGPELSGRVDHPPPRHLDVGGRQDPADEARPLRVSGRVGHVAVRRHLALPQGADHVEDPPLPHLGVCRPIHSGRFIPDPSPDEPGHRLRMSAAS